MYNSSNKGRSFDRSSGHSSAGQRGGKTGGFRRGHSNDRRSDAPRSDAPRSGSYSSAPRSGGSSAPRTGSYSSAPRSGGYSSGRGGRSFSSGESSRSSGGYRGGSSYSRGGSSYSRGGSSGSRGGSGKRRFQGKFIHEDKFVNKNPKTKEQENFTPKNTFADFGFDKRIVANLTKKGYTHPTRIQDEAIPFLMQGRNVVGLANTGSGKTAAFALPILHKIKTLNNRQTALIIAPTRELATQIDDEIKIFGQGMGIYTALCVGGMSISFQKRQLQRNPEIIIGTPGRLKDLFNQKCLNLKSVATLVLDEADRMLDMGFLKDIEFLISKLSEKPQSLCFSATITPDIKKIIDKILPDPVTVSVRTSETAEHIAQDVIKVTSGDHKMDMLLEMLGKPHFEKVLIFGEMKHSVQRLAESLSKAGFPSEAIHGNKSQAQRNRSLDAFKRGKVNILVATDVAARGLDIPNVTHVINFDKPNTYEDYIHRIGRTGRAGKKGQAYTFVGHSSR